VTDAGFPQTFALPPPPQVAGAVQVPHVRTLPQPSETVPHVAFADAQVAGVHLPEPQVFGPPPPQLCGAVHVPHESMPLQPSEMDPQVALWSVQVVGTQTGATAPTLSPVVGNDASPGSMGFDGSTVLAGESP